MPSHTHKVVELELLLLRCRRADGASLEQLVRRFERPLFFFIRRIVRNEASDWDALQNTWIRVFAALPKMRDPAGLTAWLYRIARNTALNHVRDEARQQSDFVDDADTLPGTSDADDFRLEDAEEIHKALDQLALPDREVLTLFFLDELTIAETAHVLDAPAGTIKSRLHFAKRRLRLILEKRRV